MSDARLYGPDDAAPAAIVCFSGLQHAGVLAAYLTFPLAVLQAGHIPPATAAAVLSLSFVAIGIGTVLQAHPRTGSGYLCPATFAAVFIGPSIVALQRGGLPLVFGMTIFAGAVEAALAPAVRRLRWLMPPEVVAVVVLLIGLTIGSIAIQNAGRFHLDPSPVAAWGAAGVTFATMAALSVRGRGPARLFSVLAGMVAGYLFAWHSGVLGTVAKSAITAQPLFGFPQIGHVGLAFDRTMMLPFGIAALASAIKAAGVIAVAADAAGQGWGPDAPCGVARGVFADGVGTVIGGLMGTTGINSAPSSVALVKATRVASRQVAWMIGATFIAFAFLPQLGFALAHLPPPVVAGTLLYTGSFVLVNGMQMLCASGLDSRKTLVAGLAVFSALAVRLQPGFAGDVPDFLAPVVASPLVFGIFVGIAANLLLSARPRRIAPLLIPRGRGRNETVLPMN